MEVPRLGRLVILIMNNEVNVHGFVYRNNILIYNQQDATLHSLFYLETALHVSGGTITHNQERKKLSTYATHSTLRPVPTLPR
jgi:hypothetical protein